jgi:hypothetical protein
MNHGRDTDRRIRGLAERPCTYDNAAAKLRIYTARIIDKSN